MKGPKECERIITQMIEERHRECATFEGRIDNLECRMAKCRDNGERTLTQQRIDACLGCWDELAHEIVILNEVYFRLFDAYPLTKEEVE